MDTIANSMPQAGKSMMIGSHLVTPAERTHVDNFEEEKIMDMDEFVMADEGGQVEKNVHTFLRQVKAPKGKLGVHVKMTSAGPVIDNLEPDSPMKNVFVPDDLIVAVNGVNVRKMSADEYTDIIISSNDSERDIMFITTRSKYVRTIEAPAGKLGLVLKTTSAGPAVIDMKENSPLIGIVCIGDIVSGIDQVNAKDMSAPEVRAIMKYTESNVRKLIIVSDYESPAHFPHHESEGADEAVAEDALVSAAPAEDPETTEDSTPAYPPRVSREVVAQPGKLGLHLITSEAGPVIHKIKSTSQLKGSVVVSDMIKYFDGVDTSNMTATACSALMARNLDKERTLVVENDAGVKPVTARPETSEADIDSAEMKEEEEADEAVQFVPKETIDVDAPAGKMGLNMCASSVGSIVHRVKPGSPLEGLVSPGDIIIAVDGVDTRSMSTSEIAKLMSQSGRNSRRLSLLDISKDVPIIGERADV